MPVAAKKGDANEDSQRDKNEAFYLSLLGDKYLKKQTMFVQCQRVEVEGCTVVIRSLEISTYPN